MKPTDPEPHFPALSPSRPMHDENKKLASVNHECMHAMIGTYKGCAMPLTPMRNKPGECHGRLEAFPNVWRGLEIWSGRIPISSKQKSGQLTRMSPSALP